MSDSRPQPRLYRQRGIALVVVLWGLVLLAAIAGSFAAGSRTDTVLARNGAENAKARALADAAIARAILEMLDNKNVDRWRSDGTVYRFAFADGNARIWIMDEVGKVDLNTAPDSLIRAAFRAADLADDDADAMVDAVADFRDTDDLVRLHGAEDKDYEQAGLPFGAKDAPFESVDELLRVLGMNADLYQTVAPLFTVHSRRRGINPTTASPRLLRALPGAEPESIDEMMKRRADATAGSPAPILGVLTPPPGTRFVSNTPYATIATIHAQARTRNGAQFVREAIVRIAGNPTSPYRVLDWRQGRRQRADEPR